MSALDRNPSSTPAHQAAFQISGRALLLLAVIVLLAGLLRFTGLAIAPVGGHGDVAWIGINALDWVDRGIWPFYVRELYAPEPFVPMLTGLLLPISGVSYLTPRLVTVLTGLLFVAMLFPATCWLLADKPQRFRERAGLLAALAGAVSLHAMNLSRLGMESPPFLAVLTLLIWLTARAWQLTRASGITTQRGGFWVSWILAGVALGLAQYVYLPARLLPVVLALWIGYGWLTDRANRQRTRSAWRGWLIMAVASFITALPALILFATTPRAFGARADAGTAATGGWIWNFDTSAQGGILSLLIKKIALTLLAFGISWNGPYTIMGQPMVGALFFLGLLIAVGLLIRQPRQIALAWPVLAIPVMLITDLISGATVEIHALHQMGVLPFVFILCGVGLAYGWEALTKQGWLSLRWRPVVASGLLLIGVVPSLVGLNRYLSQVIPAEYANPQTGWQANQIDVDISNQITGSPDRAYLLPYSEYTRSGQAWLDSAAFRERRSAINVNGILQVPNPPAELTVVQPADPYRPRHDGYPSQPDPRRWVLLYHGQTLFLPPFTAAQADTLTRAIENTPPGAARPVIDRSQTTIATFHSIPTPEGLFAPRPVIDYPIDATFDGQIRLLGYTLPAADLTPGKVVYVTLFWHALSAPAYDDDVIVQIWNDAGQAVAGTQDFPYGGMYRTRIWQTGEVVATHHWLSIPADLPVGRYTLAVGLSRLMHTNRLAVAGPNADTTVNFAKAPDLRFPPKFIDAPAIPADQTPRQPIQFGTLFSVAGLDVRLDSAALVNGQHWIAHSGQVLSVNVTWKTLERPTVDYSAFLHVVSAVDAPPVAQADATMGGAFPTGAWRPGNLLQDRLSVTLPSDLSPGEYKVLMGVYYWQSGERLSISTGADYPSLPDKRLTLGTLVVEK